MIRVISCNMRRSKRYMCLCSVLHPQAEPPEPIVGPERCWLTPHIRFMLAVNNTSFVYDHEASV